MRILISTAILAALAIRPPPVPLPEPVEDERFTAYAVRLGTSPDTAHYEFVISRWSTPEEQGALFEALKRGQDALATALRDTRPLGYFRDTTRLSRDLHYAQQHVSAGGTRRIRLATDRPVGRTEVLYPGALRHYPITFIELTVDPGGEGRGELFQAARVRFADDGTRLRLADGARPPVLLRGVKRAEPSPPGT